MPTQARTTESLARRAIEVLTEHDLSPATRDLVTLEGVGPAGWAETDELVSLVDVILSEYEAAAVAADNYDAVRAILRVREDCRPEPPKVRQRTKMEYCDRHRASFLSESVYRRVEVMAEGGWASGGPCEGGRCKLYPGRDYICRETCEEYGLGEMPLDWTTEPDDDLTEEQAVRAADRRARESDYPTDYYALPREER